MRSVSYQRSQMHQKFERWSHIIQVQIHASNDVSGCLRHVNRCYKPAALRMCTQGTIEYNYIRDPLGGKDNLTHTYSLILTDEARRGINNTFTYERSSHAILLDFTDLEAHFVKHVSLIRSHTLSMMFLAEEHYEFRVIQHPTLSPFTVTQSILIAYRFVGQLSATTLLIE